jgi:aminoglycoside phosphotransferase (APT) family kinase protein
MTNGHAGHTYGVDLRDDAGCLSHYVLKLAPAAVRRSGSTDIFRQAALLEALRKAALPVPEVRWSSASEDEFGAPFIVMTRLEGVSYIIWEPDQCFERASLPGFWIEAANVLAQIHALDHRSLLAGWELPTSLPAELERWSALIRHSEASGWQEILRELSVALRLSTPTDGPIGLIHGDFQPGNILFAEETITGIIDWDLAAIGPQGLDMGWYLMMADSDNWNAAWRPVGPASRADIVAAYARSGGQALDDLPWHQAFAQFRLGVIAGLNLKLHRTGRRIDPVWERFAMSVPTLLRTAFNLLGCEQVT